MEDALFAQQLWTTTLAASLAARLCRGRRRPLFAAGVTTPSGPQPRRRLETGVPGSLSRSLKAAAAAATVELLDAPPLPSSSSTTTTKRSFHHISRHQKSLLPRQRGAFLLSHSPTLSLSLSMSAACGGR